MTPLPTPKILLTFALALLLAGCAANKPAPIRTIHDKPVEVPSSTKFIKQAKEQYAEAEKAFADAMNQADSDAMNLLVSVRNEFQDIAEPLNNADANQLIADDGVARLQSQLTDTQARLTASEEARVDIQAQLDDERTGQGVALAKMLGYFGGLMLIGGVLGYVLSPMKKVAIAGAGGGLALIIISQTLGTYRKEIALGGLILGGVSVLGWAIMQFIDARKRQQEAEVTRASMKEVVESVEAANDQTKDLNLTPEVKKVFSEHQSPKTQELVFEIKKEIKAEKAGGITDSKLDAKIDAKIDHATTGVVAVVEKAESVVEKAEAVVERVEDVVEDAKSKP